MDQALAELVECPTCHEPLTLRHAITCTSCGIEFPVVGGIPCLFPEPQRQIGDWRRQAQRLADLMERQVQALAQGLERVDLLPATRRRLERVQAAHIENSRRVIGLLAAAGLAPDPKAKASEGDYLLDYYSQVLRDWAWDRDGAGENGRAYELLTSRLGDDRALGRTLVLGAGPCRLAYDLHMSLRPSLTVALDINPLLLLAGQRTMMGEPWRLVEFPAEPRSLDSVVVDHELSASRGKPEGLHLLLADAFAPPLRAHSFDTVITPWFIDIVAADVRRTLGIIHRLLVPDGRWLNCGPLSYQKNHPNPQRYTPEELFELIRLAGFALGEPREDRFAFLKSPASAPERHERVITFAARKLDPLPVVTTDPPAWLMLSHLPIPRFEGLDGYQPQHPVLAYLRDLIDGRATLDDLADRMIKKHGARPEAALDGTRAMVNVLMCAAQERR